MKLYKLESVRNYMQTKISKMDIDEKIKKEMNEHFSPSFIINTYKISNVKFQKHYSLNMLIDIDILKKHLINYQNTFNHNVKITKFNKFLLDFSEEQIITHSVDEFPVKINEIANKHYSNISVKDLIKIKKESLELERSRKEHFESILVTHFPENLRNSKIVSIDFEYDKDKLYEVGISLYDNNIVYNKYYIVNLKQGTRDNQFRFQFGESLVVSDKTIVHLLKRYLSQTEYLLLHGGYNDISILNKFGIELKDFSNIKILDTYLLYPKYFNNGAIDNSSLISILDRFNIDHKHLHNAGNDSNYTLEALLKMHNEVHLPYQESAILSRKKNSLKK